MQPISYLTDTAKTLALPPIPNVVITPLSAPMRFLVPPKELLPGLPQQSILLIRSIYERMGHLSPTKDRSSRIEKKKILVGFARVDNCNFPS